jgi:hypothetical protein
MEALAEELVWQNACNHLEGVRKKLDSSLPMDRNWTTHTFKWQLKVIQDWVQTFMHLFKVQRSSISL